MSKNSYSHTAPNLDDLLLDIATAIELSEADRRIAEKRYRKLKEHLERPQSPLAAYLADNDSMIYPQGSMAIGTTIVSGDKDDRFDVDALVELNVPSGWSPDKVLDLLYEALKDFPGIEEIERCTRCVQLRFASMHMDVTVLDPNQAEAIERAGEIFHSPDSGQSKRVPANPYGFSKWFRSSVDLSNQKFSEVLTQRRATNGIDRLKMDIEYKAAEQEELPDIIPPRLDSEQVVALKLLKRYLNQKYQDRALKKPPSIYLTKLAADVDLSQYGLSAQLAALAQHVKDQMDVHIANYTTPDERNPSYTPDMLNDRWPQNREDMKVLSNDMGALLSWIKEASAAEFTDIKKIFMSLFGEKVTLHSVERLKERASTMADKPSQYEKGVGTVVPSAAAAPAIIGSAKTEPQHSFHSKKIGKKSD